MLPGFILLLRSFCDDEPSAAPSKLRVLIITKSNQFTSSPRTNGYLMSWSCQRPRIGQQHQLFMQAEEPVVLTPTSFRCQSMLDPNKQTLLLFTERFFQGFARFFSSRSVTIAGQGFGGVPGLCQPRLATYGSPYSLPVYQSCLQPIKGSLDSSKPCKVTR